MQSSIFALAALAALLPQVSVGHLSFRSKGTAVVSRPCSCDCCLVEEEDQAVNHRVGALKCAPKYGSFAEASRDTDSGCSNICMLPSELRSDFQSEKGDADYSRFCSAQCSPASSKLHELCVDSSLIETETPAPRAAKLSVKKSNSMTQFAAELEQRNQAAQSASAASESALVLLAKQKEEEAKLQAEAAGRAAFTARTAYERLKLAVDEMAVQASQTTLDEIKAEAAQQSKKARDIRLAYEKNAQATAIKNAQGAAKVYASAMGRDMLTATVWNERAMQFATAANQREKMAMTFSEDAEEFRQRNNMAMSKQRIVLAHQAIDQAAAFGAQSEAAHKQAQAIADSKTWYEYAKRAVAAFMLAKSMPHDVPPPPMPPLP